MCQQQQCNNNPTQHVHENVTTIQHTKLRKEEENTLLNYLLETESDGASN